MKLLMTTAAVAALITSSAYAQQTSQKRVLSKPSSAYAQLLASEHVGAPHISGNAVYVDGRVVGQDPDPNIRLQLLRDPPGLSQ
jgi:hypothetical protein